MTALCSASRSDPSAAFEVGREYTRIEIAARVGGGRRDCLPTRDGVVVAACLLTSLNPDAPRAMLCGVGPRITPVSTLLAHQRSSIPLFTKRAVNRWLHEGTFVVTATITSGPEFDRWVARSDRTVASVSRVVLFEPAA